MDIRRHPRFKGRFFTTRVTTFVDQENRSKVGFLVFSSGKREVVKKMLWLKLVHDQLTKIEYELFISLIDDKDVKIWSFLKLLLVTPKRLLRKRLLETESQQGDEVSTRASYIGTKSINIEIQKETRRLPKTKKFSGYIRSLASRGKNQLGTGRIELPSITIPDFKDEINQFALWEAWLALPSLESFPEQEK
jgi:hypothetical protein